MRIPSNNSWIDKKTVQLFVVLIQVKKYLYSYLFNGIHFKILGFELVKMNPSWIQNTSNPAMFCLSSYVAKIAGLNPAICLPGFVLSNSWIRFE